MSSTRVQIEIALGALFVVLAAVLLLFLGFEEEDALASALDTQTAEKIEVGAHLFHANCARCHGEQGEGLIGPPLNDAAFFTTRIEEVGWPGTLEDYIISTVAVGRLVSTRPEQWPGEGYPAMPLWSVDYGGPLRNDEIEDIATFILNWEESATDGVVISVDRPPAPSSEDPLARGKAVFGAYGCAACHQLDDAGAVGVVGPTLNGIATTSETRLEGYTAEEYIIESIINTNAYIVEGYQENLMPQNFGDQMSEQELSDLVLYLLSQE
jgi:mono/diheme cytochrome c family protein